MFTTMTLHPPLPNYSEILSMLHSYDSWILLQDSQPSSSQVAFAVNKFGKNKQTFTSEKKGFNSATITIAAKTTAVNKPTVSNLTQGKQSLCTDEEVMSDLS